MMIQKKMTVQKKQIIVGMHQPNFMPWLGFFYKVFQSDIFIFVDDVQFTKSGSSYTNTIQLNERGKRIILPVPIKRGSGVQKINKLEYAKHNWQRKIIRSLELNYGKCTYFKEEKEFIFNLISNNCSNFSEYNIMFIKEISKRLDIETKFEISSKIETEVVENATDRIIKLAKYVNATHFISGRGGDNYQDHVLYDENNIKLTYSDFEDFKYTQYRTDEFVKGLSILDAIFNIGFDNIKLKFNELNKV